MRSPDVMTAPEGRHTSVPPFAGTTTARSVDPGVLLVTRRHVDLGRLASALCR
jgi:hypothetical protein